MLQVVVDGQNAYNVAGVTLVTGLLWLTEPGLSRKAAVDRARKEGRETGRDSYATYQYAKTWQYGLCSAADATKKSAVYAGAAMLADAAKSLAYPATWAGAFDLGNGMAHWVLVRDSAITPNGDVIVTHEVAAELLSQAAAEGVELRVGDIEGCTARATLSTMLGARPRVAEKYRVLRPGDKAARSLKLWVVPAVVLVLLSAGLGVWWWLDAQEEEARQRAADAARRAAQATAKSAVELVQPPRPWLDTPSARTVVKSCTDTLSQFAPRPAGWQIPDAGCERGVLTAALVRTAGAGSVDDLLTVAPAAVVANTGASATLAITLPDAPADGRALEPDAHAFRKLVSTLQSTRLRFSIDAPTPPALPALPEGKQYAPILWKQRKTTITATTRQLDALLTVAGAPGLRATKVAVANQTITLEGILYVQ